MLFFVGLGLFLQDFVHLVFSFQLRIKSADVLSLLLSDASVTTTWGGEARSGSKCGPYLGAHSTYLHLYARATPGTSDLGPSVFFAPRGMTKKVNHKMTAEGKYTIFQTFQEL